MQGLRKSRENRLHSERMVDVAEVKIWGELAHHKAEITSIALELDSLLEVAKKILNEEKAMSSIISSHSVVCNTMILMTCMDTATNNCSKLYAYCD